MNIDVQEYARKLRQTPPVPCDLKVGDRVTFTNEFGVSFSGCRIIGFADDSFYGRFIHFVGAEHPDAFWFPVRLSEVKKGGSMNINQSEMLAVQFADCMARLRALGLQAEITVQAGVVMVATHDKANASHFRKAIKTACRNAGVVSTESRPNAVTRIFTIVC